MIEEADLTGGDLFLSVLLEAFTTVTLTDATAIQGPPNPRKSLRQSYGSHNKKNSKLIFDGFRSKEQHQRSGAL